MNNINTELLKASKGMLESLRLALGESSPLPAMAKDVIRGLFLGEEEHAKRAVAAAEEEPARVVIEVHRGVVEGVHSNLEAELEILDRDILVEREEMTGDQYDAHVEEKIKGLGRLL